MKRHGALCAGASRVLRRWGWVVFSGALILGTSCARKERPELLVLGLDGATWDLLDPLLDAGKLPNLKSFRDQSAWGTMNSVIPYLSPPAWTSAVTGVNPGRHGIFDFQRRLPGQNKIVTETAKDRRSPPIWNMIKGRGLRALVMNVPMTDPPDEIEGSMISGFPHLDDHGYAYPAALEDRIEAMGYLRDEMEMKLPPGEEQQIFDRYLATLRARWKVLQTLYQEERYDLVWVVFTETDRVQHCFWRFDDPESPAYDAVAAARFGGSIERLWIEQDRILGELLAMLRPNTWVLMVSDHGFGPMHRELRVQNFMRREGSGFTHDDCNEVFSLDRSDAARLYIREPGRDPGGQLDADARAELESRLTQALSTATDPESHELPVDAVYAQSQVYVGKYAERGPTLSLLPRGAWFFTIGDVETEFEKPPFGPVTSTLSGWHRMNGIFALRGPGATPGQLTGSYSLLDVVPTCLFILGQSMAEDLDGGVMERAFAPAFLKKQKIVRQGRLSEEDRPMTPEEIEQLKNLPYMGG